MGHDAELSAIGLLQDLEWSGLTPEGASCCPVCHKAKAHRVHAPSCRLSAILGRPQPRWRHRKRGTTYREIGIATLQHSGGMLDDQDLMMVYRAESSGILGVRALLEFSDGRFERL